MDLVSVGALLSIINEARRRVSIHAPTGRSAGGVGLAAWQDALAAAYGVSRIPVREALFQLEAEGLVQIVAHKGAIVTTLSPDEINDVFDLRELLEPRLFERSIPRLTDEDFDAIATTQSKFSAAIQSKDLRVWGALNAQLHTTLYSRAQLPQTTSIVVALLQKSDRYTRVQLSSPAAMKRAEGEHAGLIELARQRQVQPACDLLLQHIRTVRADLLSLLHGAGAGASRA